MMPANYSAIAENEMTYVVGGTLGDILAPKLEVADWKRFNTNMVTLIGNAFMGSYIDNTLGKLFGGTYKPGDIATGAWEDVKTVWGKNYGGDKTSFWNGAQGVLNVALQGVGVLASIYTLGAGSIGLNVKPTVKIGF